MPTALPSFSTRKLLLIILAGAVLWTGIGLAVVKIVNGAPDPVSCAGYPEPRVYIQSQSWWTQAGEAFPGRHIHLETCFPLMQTISGTGFDLDVFLRLHNNPGKVTSLRAQTWGSSSNVSGNIVVPGSWSCATADCTFGPIRIHPQLPKDGRWEIRLTFNIPTNVFGKRQYQTTRWDVCARTCAGNSQQPLVDRMGAAGWYDGADYENVRINAADGLALAYSPVTTPRSIRIWGEDTTLTAAIDPNYHALDMGVVIYQGAAGSVWRTVTIPALPSGPHRLVLKDCHTITAGENCGVFALPFNVP